jgi:hypothetical protein
MLTSAFILSLIITLPGPGAQTYKRYLPISEPVVEFADCRAKWREAKRLNTRYNFVCQRVRLTKKP